MAEQKQPDISRKEVILREYDAKMSQILNSISQTNPQALPAFIMTAELNRIIVGMLIDLSQELKVWLDVMERAP